MILKTLAIVAVLIAAVLVFAATKPNIFRIERSTTIQAPPEKVFALLNDFHNWSRWEPQDREDATMRRTFSGLASGVGSVTEWDSSGSAGKGRAEMIESLPLREVSVKVDFVRPLAVHNINEFTLEPDGLSTKVTWSMHGTNLYIMKLMSVFMNMDRMVGKHFDSGLQNLKVVAETGR